MVSMTVTPADHAALAASAVSYALGRGTFGTDTVIEWLHADNPWLPAAARDRITGLIADYDHHGWLGRPANAWRTVAGILAAGDEPGDGGMRFDDTIQRRVVLTSAFRRDVETGDPTAPARWTRLAHDHPDEIAACTLEREYTLAQGGPAWDTVRDKLTALADRIDIRTTPIHGGAKAAREGWA